MTNYIQKKEDTVAILEKLADGPVDCEVSDGGDWVARKVNGLDYANCLPFISDRVRWRFARLPRPKPRRPWTAEEIMAHGVFERCGDIVRPLAADTDNVHIAAMHSGTRIYANVTVQRFIEGSRAVCLELRDGILCDTGKRVELYKDGE